MWERLLPCNSCNDATPLLSSLIADDLQHFIPIRRLFEGLAKFRLVQELGNISQRVKMFLELALGNQEQHDQVNGLIVQRVEVDALLGPAKRAHHFVDQVRRSMRNPDTEPDAGA